jgi:hypothetical protein
VTVCRHALEELDAGMNAFGSERRIGINPIRRCVPIEHLTLGVLSRLPAGSPHGGATLDQWPATKPKP